MEAIHHLTNFLSPSPTIRSASILCMVTTAAPDTGRGTFWNLKTCQGLNDIWPATVSRLPGRKVSADIPALGLLQRLSQPGARASTCPGQAAVCTGTTAPLGPEATWTVGAPEGVAVPCPDAGGPFPTARTGPHSPSCCCRSLRGAISQDQGCVTTDSVAGRESLSSFTTSIPVGSPSPGVPSHTPTCPHRPVPLSSPSFPALSLSTAAGAGLRPEPASQGLLWEQHGSLCDHLVGLEKEGGQVCGHRLEGDTRRGQLGGPTARLALAQVTSSGPGWRRVEAGEPLLQETSSRSTALTGTSLSDTLSRGAHKEMGTTLVFPGQAFVIFLDQPLWAH